MANYIQNDKTRNPKVGDVVVARTPFPHDYIVGDLFEEGELGLVLYVTPEFKNFVYVRINPSVHSTGYSIPYSMRTFKKQFEIIDNIRETWDEDEKTGDTKVNAAEVNAAENKLPVGITMKTMYGSCGSKSTIVLTMESSNIDLVRKVERTLENAVDNLIFAVKPNHSKIIEAEWDE